MRSILIGNGLVSEETDAELVHQSVGFERMISTLPLHEMGSYLAQFRLDDGKELVTRMRIALPPQAEPLSDLFVACHRPHGAIAMIQTGAYSRYIERGRASDHRDERANAIGRNLS
jgi:hypothetical protein